MSMQGVQNPTARERIERAEAARDRAGVEAAKLRERVAELDHELQTARADVARLQALCDKTALAAAKRALRGGQDHALCFVPVETQWALVCTGDMTIARDGTPWMVEERWGVGMVRLRQGEKTFDKAPAEGEMVRVLVPYARAAAIVALREHGQPREVSA